MNDDTLKNIIKNMGYELEIWLKDPMYYKVILDEYNTIEINQEIIGGAKKYRVVNIGEKNSVSNEIWHDGYSLAENDFINRVKNSLA